MKFLKIPEATIKRLSVYARYLSNMNAQDRRVISSAELAEECGMNAAQIRKEA